MMMVSCWELEFCSWISSIAVKIYWGVHVYNVPYLIYNGTNKMHIVMIKVYYNSLPWQVDPFPKYPALHSQIYVPISFVHVAFGWQGFLVTHSSISNILVNHLITHAWTCTYNCQSSLHIPWHSSSDPIMYPFLHIHL